LVRRSTPQLRGRDFEKEHAKRLQSEHHKDSGAAWWRKLDVDGHRILWSNKYTEKDSIRITSKDIDEMVDAVYAPGGPGPDHTPAMAARMAGRHDLVVLRFEDFIKLASEKPIVMVQKDEVKRQRASIPELLRD
jgi:hypothetical protein